MPTTEKVTKRCDDGDHGFYPEANYQHSVDMYNSNASFGLSSLCKENLALRVAVGPEIFWGAKLTVTAK